MNLKNLSVPGSLATWLIAVTLLLNTLLMIAGGAMFVRMERYQMRMENQMCGAIELQRGWAELQAAQKALNQNQ